MDEIKINGLTVMGIIGCHGEEREKPQKLIFNITLRCDLREAGETDDLSKTVDYSQVASRITEFTEASSYYLIEGLAEGVAKLVLGEWGMMVSSVVVDVIKPGIIPNVASSEVIIERRLEHTK